MAFKVFTNGSTLQASEVNDNLMRQAVSTFSNAAARTAAITAPSEGMLTYLEDTNLYQHWNGSAWVSPFGLTLLNRTSFTAQTEVSVSNVFSSDYDNYKIVVVANINSSGASTLFGRLLSSGTPSTASYQMNRLAYNLGTGAVQNTAVETVYFNMGWIPFGSTAGHISSIELSRPFVAQATGMVGQFAGDAAGAYASAGFMFGNHLLATSYDGFRIGTTGGFTMTGNIRIYGYRNA